jgi:DNA-binding protein WhiA
MAEKEKKIPFAKKVKEEISAIEYTTEQKKWILSGFARNGGAFRIGTSPSLSMKSEIANVAKLLYSALKDYYGLNPEIRYEKVKRFGRGLVFEVYVSDKRLYEVMEDLEIFQDGLFRIPPKEGLHRRYLKYMIIGSFLANGSVNNPSSSKTSYFLEMAYSDKQDALAVRRKIDTFKEERTMNFKYIKRREKHVLYLKRSDQISVFLSYVGAMEAMFEFENARVTKDEMNMENRLNICDTANLSKTISTAKRDIDLITELLKVKPLGLYDPKTQAVINARLKLKDSNYRELAEYISTQEEIAITKSGVVHILANLRNEAEELKKAIQPK